MTREELIKTIVGVIIADHHLTYYIDVDFDEHPNIKLTTTPSDGFIPPVTICVSDAPGPPYGHFTVVIDTNLNGFHRIEYLKMDSDGHVYYR